MYLPPLIGSVRSAWYQQGDVLWKVQMVDSWQGRKLISEEEKKKTKYANEYFNAQIKAQAILILFLMWMERNEFTKLMAYYVFKSFLICSSNKVKSSMVYL